MTMELGQLGRALVIGGITLTVLGLLLLLFARMPGLSRLGSLPGDLRIEGNGFTCLFPIVTTILLSIIATIVLNIVIRLINRS